MAGTSMSRVVVKVFSVESHPPGVAVCSCLQTCRMQPAEHRPAVLQLHGASFCSNRAVEIEVALTHCAQICSLE